MAWAQTVLTGFERNNWTVREGWTLDLVTGHLDFEATYREAQVTDVPGGKLVTAPAGVGLTAEELAEMKRRFVSRIAESKLDVDITLSAEGVALVRCFETLSVEKRNRLLNGNAFLLYKDGGWMVP